MNKSINNVRTGSGMSGMGRYASGKSAGNNKSSDTRRVALVHDWLPVLGGAEKVLEHLLRIYPQADVFTLFDFRLRSDHFVELRGSKRRSNIATPITRLLLPFPNALRMGSARAIFEADRYELRYPIDVNPDGTAQASYLGRHLVKPGRFVYR